MPSGPSRQALAKRFTVEVLHHQIAGVVILSDVEQRADVRVRERGDGARLALEPEARFRRVGERGRDDLDRDGAMEPCVGLTCIVAKLHYTPHYSCSLFP